MTLFCSSFSIFAIFSFFSNILLSRAMGILVQQHHMFMFFFSLFDFFFSFFSFSFSFFFSFREIRLINDSLSAKNQRTKSQEGKIKPSNCQPTERYFSRLSAGSTRRADEAEGSFLMNAMRQKAECI